MKTFKLLIASMTYCSFSNQLNKSLFIGLLSLLLCTCVSAQSIKLLPFHENENLSFTCSRTKSSSNNDTLFSVNTLVFDVSLKVLRTSPSGSTLEWIYTLKKNEFKLSDEKKSRRPIITTALDLANHELYEFKTLRVIYETDSSGAFKKVVNVDELRAHVRKALDKVKEEKKSNKEIIVALEQFTPAFLSDEYLAYSFIQDIHLYHQLNGTDLNLKKEIYEIEIPNPLTGKGVPGTLTTEGFENADQSYTYTMRQKIDQEKMSKVVTDKIKDAYGKIDGSKKDPPPVDYQSSYTYMIKKKRITQAKLINSVTSGQSTAIEELNIY